MVNTFFLFFAAVAAEFWHKTVMYLRAVQKARFQAQTGRTTRKVDRPQPIQAVFYMFFSRIREIRVIRG